MLAMETQMERIGFIYNHDDSCWCADKYLALAGEGEAGLRKLVDVYAGGNMTEFFVCVNSKCADFDSNVISPYGWNLAPLSGTAEPQNRAEGWIRKCATEYIAKGIDANAILLDQCRKRGVAGWISIRMNDCHNTFELDNPIHSKFWLERKDLWCVPNDNRANGSLTDRAFDYSKREVRDYFLAFLKECLERYDCDGVELDFMRFPRYFPEGNARSKACFLNEFMRNARAIVDAEAARRGHSIGIAARVDSRPDTALDNGKDFITWSKEGLIDRLIVSNFWSSVDFNIPYSEWTRLVASANPDVEVIPGMDGGACLVDPQTGYAKRHLLSYGEYAVFIDRMIRQGAKTIYFFNLFDIKPESGVWDKLVLGPFDPDSIAKAAYGVAVTDIHD